MATPIHFTSMWVCVLERILCQCYTPFYYITLSDFVWFSEQDCKVLLFYMKGQASTDIQECQLLLAGDGRCDSPGSSAKLVFTHWWTLPPTSWNDQQAEMIDKREVHLQSPNMEWEGFMHALSFLLGKLDDSVIVNEVITDASTSVRTVLGMHSD